MRCGRPISAHCRSNAAQLTRAAVLRFKRPRPELTHLRPDSDRCGPMLARVGRNCPVLPLFGLATLGPTLAALVQYWPTLALIFVPPDNLLWMGTPRTQGVWHRA